jgi:hypothetical protein
MHPQPTVIGLFLLQHFTLIQQVDNCLQVQFQLVNTQQCEPCTHLFECFHLCHNVCLSIADGISSVALSPDLAKARFLIPTTKFPYGNYLRFAIFAALIACSSTLSSASVLVIAQVLALSNLLDCLRDVLALFTYCAEASYAPFKSLNLLALMSLVNFLLLSIALKIRRILLTCVLHDVPVAVSRALTVKVPEQIAKAIANHKSNADIVSVRISLSPFTISVTFLTACANVIVSTFVAVGFVAMTYPFPMRIAWNYQRRTLCDCRSAHRIANTCRNKSFRTETFATTTTRNDYLMRDTNGTTDYARYTRTQCA